MQSRHAWDDPILTQPVAAPSNRRAFRRYASPITRGGAQVHSFVGPALPIIPHPPPYASSEAMSQLHDKLIGTVPSRIVEQAAIALTTYDGRVAEFNVASWLQLQGHAGLMVSLVAKYRDGQQQREAIIDHGRTDGAGKILLSGVARLPVRHKIEELQIHLRPAATVAAITVEELFAHPVEPVAAEMKAVQA